MLWIAVLAVYLSVLRAASLPYGMCVIVTAWLLALSGIRLLWGRERGLPIALLATIAMTFLFTLSDPHLDALIVCYVSGCVLGFAGFWAICGGVSALNWLDGLGKDGSARAANRPEDDATIK